MGIVRKASAISAGALAITLGGALPLAASPARALDCTPGGGLVSGITGNLCTAVDGVGGLVDGVTDLADKATGGAAKPLTKTVDDVVNTTTGTAGTAVNDVGRTVDKAGQAVTGAADTAAGAATGAVDSTAGAATGAVDSTAGAATGAVGSAAGAATGGGTTGKGDHDEGNDASAAPAVTPGVGELTEDLTRTVQDTCLPLVAGKRCAGGEERGAGEGSGTGGKRGGTRPPSRAKPSATPAATLPAEPYRPGLARASDDTPTGGRRSTVNPDEDGMIPLLWPGQRIPELPNLGGGAASRPLHAHRSYDVAGTALTATLLLSALLATRVVSARRARAGQQEQRESIPFEGGLRLPESSGRHRLA